MKHTHTLAWGNHVVADGENGEPRHLDGTDTENPGVFTSATEQWVALTIAVPGS